MQQSTRVWGLGLAAVATIILWQLPFGAYLLYPFTILATWFHEMGHGLAALILGGSFSRLELFTNGSGFAVYHGPLFLGGLGQALVAAAGPIGPACCGALLIVSSKSPRACKISLYILAEAMFIANIFWLRSWFGVVIISLLAAFFLYIAMAGSPRWQSLTVQFLGVQASISVFLQIGYLFTKNVPGLGLSDTGQIAALLLLPYWFWGVLLTALTLFLPAASLAAVVRKK